jgi:hypothetical protein
MYLTKWKGQVKFFSSNQSDLPAYCESQARIASDCNNIFNCQNPGFASDCNNIFNCPNPGFASDRNYVGFALKTI